MFLIFILIIFVIRSVLNDSVTGFYYPIIQVFFSISFTVSWKNSAFQVLISFVVSSVITVLENYRINESTQSILNSYFIIINFVISFSAISTSYLLELTKRKEFMALKQIEFDVENFNNILNYLLPEFVRKRVKDGVRYIAEDKGVVSVIFCDIYEFDKIIEDYNPNELINFLDDVFEKLDELCETIGVTKIETVGKTYLACAGLKDSELEMNSSITSISHARRAVNLGLAILNESSQIILKSGEHLKFKIGINSGPVTAGVVGLHKPQFSLVGDTVNTASRMASTLSEPHAVQISLDTFLLLDKPKDLRFIPNYPEVKGKGIMNTMIVTNVVDLNMMPSLESYSVLECFHGDEIHSNLRSLKMINSEPVSETRLHLPKQIFRKVQTKIIKSKQTDRMNLLKNVFCYENKNDKAFQAKLREF